MTYDRILVAVDTTPDERNPVLQRTEQFAKMAGSTGTFCMWRRATSSRWTSSAHPPSQSCPLRAMPKTRLGRSFRDAVDRLAGRRNRSSLRDRQRDRTRRCCRRGNPAARQGAGCRPHYAGLFLGRTFRAPPRRDQSPARFGDFHAAPARRAICVGCARP